MRNDPVHGWIFHECDNKSGPGGTWDRRAYIVLLLLLEVVVVVPWMRYHSAVRRS